MSEKIPACVCTAHPSGDDKKKFMYIAECTQDFVVFCCKRCTEITHTAVVQVRTLKHGKEKSLYEVEQQRRQMPPELLRMLMARKKGGLRIPEREHAR